MTTVIDYSFYGTIKDAILCRDQETIIAGPADTGKTIGLLWKLDALAKCYDGCSLVIARKQQTDLWSTVIESFKKNIVKDQPIRAYGGEKPEFFEYPNGSRIWTAGLDKPGKVLSAEHDVIYVNQAEELQLADWETLTTRTTGRAGHMPYSQCIGDCNPAHPRHWIIQRRDMGFLTLFQSTHHDNPSLYDPVTGLITEDGTRRIGALRNLTGVRKLRLYSGLWVAPEGAIYDVFDETRHKVAHFDPPLIWPRIVGIDPAGAYKAAVWLAIDPQSGIINVYRELYEPFGTTVGAFCDAMRKASGYDSAGRPQYRVETILAWICGAKAERDWRTEFGAAGIPVIEPPISDVWVGIDRVYDLLKDFRLVIHDNCTHLLSEVVDYRRKLDNNDQPTDNIESKNDYHSADCLRYSVAWLMEPGSVSQVINPRVSIGNAY